MRFPVTEKEYATATFWACLVLAVLVFVHSVLTVLFSLEMVNFRKRLVALEAQQEQQQQPPQKQK